MTKNKLKLYSSIEDLPVPLSRVTTQQLDISSVFLHAKDKDLPVLFCGLNGIIAPNEYGGPLSDIKVLKTIDVPDGFNGVIIYFAVKEDIEREGYPVRERRFIRLNFELFRLKNGKCHCEYDKAHRSFYVWNLEQNGLKPISSDTASSYYLNGVAFATKKAWSAALKNNLSVSKSIYKSRIKLNGEIEIGEEFAAFGMNDRIIWVMNGTELWALDIPYRLHKTEAGAINAKWRSLGESKDRLFLVDSSKLEEMVVDTVGPMLKSTSPT